MRTGELQGTTESPSTCNTFGAVENGIRIAEPTRQQTWLPNRRPDHFRLAPYSINDASKPFLYNGFTTNISRFGRACTATPEWSSLQVRSAIFHTRYLRVKKSTVVIQSSLRRLHLSRVRF